MNEEIVRSGSNWPWYGKLILWCVLALIIAPASCTVVTSFDDADVTKANSDYLKAKVAAAAEESAAEFALEKQQLEILERLVKEYNFGPIAARCAVKGWNSNGRATCENAGALHAAKK